VQVAEVVYRHSCAYYENAVFSQPAYGAAQRVVCAWRLGFEEGYLDQRDAQRVGVGVKCFPRTCQIASCISRRLIDLPTLKPDQTP
jgi:hypothetical protein